jgi:hypothetical protein
VSIDKELHFHDWMNSLTLDDVKHELFVGRHHRDLIAAQERRRRMFYGDSQPRLVGLTIDEVAQEFLDHEARERSQQQLADRRSKNGRNTIHRVR